MGRKDGQAQKEKQRVESVLELLKKQAPLTIKQVCYSLSLSSYGVLWKLTHTPTRMCVCIYVCVFVQEKFCNNACVERFLKAKGDNVKKAAKQLRASLSWRDSIGTGMFLSPPPSLSLALSELLNFFLIFFIFFLWQVWNNVINSSHIFHQLS